MRNFWKKAALAALVIAVLPKLAMSLAQKAAPDSYGVADIDRARAICAPPAIVDKYLRIWKDSEYNREWGAYQYLPYAVASLNAYPIVDGKNINTRALKLFKLETLDKAWIAQDISSYNAPGQIQLHSHSRTDGDSLIVLASMRGTDAFDGKDWLANFSWLTEWFAPSSYTQMRSVYSRLWQEKIRLAEQQGKKVLFIATGHSLGGGLAQHLAYAFPCTVAVSFNGSFVVNRFRLAKPFLDTRVVNIYTLGDPLSELRTLLRKGFAYVGISLELDGYRQYRIATPTIPLSRIVAALFKAHSMESLAADMARFSWDCLKTRGPSCPLPKDAINAGRFYCATYGLYPGLDEKLCPVPP